MSATLLFDLDGTLLNCDDLHLDAWREQLAPFGITVDTAFYKTRIMGYPNADILAGVLPALDAAEGARIAEAKEEGFRRRAIHLEPMKGLVDFLAFARAQRLPIGVVTNATRLNASVELSGIGLADAFDTIVIGYECEKPKPDPAPYLEGLRRLGGTASRSLAFEDSISGINAATGAGLPVVGISTGLPPEMLRAAGAALAIADYDDQRLRPFVLECTSQAAA
jgi:HAD superfamily hydrolase (TIGR01509 family)